MRSVLLLLITLACLTASAQTNEFEGEVRYVHYFKYKKFVKDTGLVIRQFGNSSYYYYKKGSYVWKFNGSDLEKEFSYNSTRKVYSKMRNKDTVQIVKPSLDTILSYSIRKNADTILGLPVDELTIVTATKADKNNKITRRIYYSSKYPILPQHASHLISFANNQVFKLTKALPLRIELETEKLPFVIRMQAVRVIPRTVTPEELALPKGVKIKG